MKYSVLLRRSNWLCELFDNDSCDFYLANPDIDFATKQDAAKAAKIEAAKADLGDVKSALAERGLALASVRKGPMVPPDNYEVILVFEGRPDYTFGWQPELAAVNRTRM